jgi:myo-inositol-1(or 4)-monophosphatase
VSIPPEFLATAVEAVVRAGAIQMAHFGAGVRVEKKGAIDLVTEVDLEVERTVRALIAERFPAHDVMAEELGTADTGARWRWVFDPLDGTTNYAHGIPIFCSTIALEIDRVPTVAAVYDPVRRELFTAERGIGAWLNGAPLRVSATDTLLDAVLVTGFPYDIRDPARMRDVVGLFAAFLAEARAVRRLGSAAIDLCWVAAGRMDGFWEQALQPWDVMGGALIVQEAGGRVTSLDGAPWDAQEGSVLASNGRLHDRMLAIVAAHREQRFTI